jgi:hypothetical protein
VADDKEQLIPTGVTHLTDETVRLVAGSRRNFPNVVIELADRQTDIDPSLDRLAVMRSLRDELVERIGRVALPEEAKKSQQKLTGANIPVVADDPNKPWSTC